MWLNDSLSVDSGNCMQKVASAVVVCRVHFADRNMDSLMEPSMDRPSASTPKPSCGCRIAWGTNLLVKTASVPGKCVSETANMEMSNVLLLSNS